MSDPDQWVQQLLVCIASFNGFTALASKIVSELQGGGDLYWNLFLDTISNIIPNKQYPSNQRFYALYLLFKATEKSDLSRGSQLINHHIELLNFLYQASQHDSVKKIAFDERGKQFFSLYPTKMDSRIGVNFVRLCFECLVIWERVFGVQQTSHPCYTFQSYCNSLRKKIKTPTYFYYIERNYDFSQDLATWNYKDNLPKQISQSASQASEEKQYIFHTQYSNRTAIKSFTEVRPAQFPPTFVKDAENEGIPNRNLLQRNKTLQEVLEPEKSYTEFENEGLIEKYQEDEKIPETNEPRLKKYGFKLKDIIADRENPHNTASEPTSAQYQSDNRDKSPFSSQKEITRPKVYEEKLAKDLSMIQTSIIKSKASSPNSVYGFSTQASSEINRNPSLKSFKSLFQNDDKSSSKPTKTFLYSFKEVDDKLSRHNSRQATPQKLAKTLSHNTSLATLTPSLHKYSSIPESYSTSTDANSNRRNTVIGTRKLTFEASPLKNEKNETVFEFQADSKSPIKWTDENPISNNPQNVKGLTATWVKTMQEFPVEYNGPVLTKTDVVATTTQTLPRKIIKFGLQS